MQMQFKEKASAKLPAHERSVAARAAVAMPTAYRIDQGASAAKRAPVSACTLVENQVAQKKIRNHIARLSK